jgi:hypothetical protein
LTDQRDVEALLVHGPERFDDRGEQDHESPEDEEVHQAGDRPLHQLALTEHHDDLIARLDPPVPGLAILVLAQTQITDQVARAGGEDPQRRQDEKRHQDLLEQQGRASLRPAKRCGV